MLLGDNFSDYTQSPYFKRREYHCMYCHRTPLDLLHFDPKEGLVGSIHWVDNTKATVFSVLTRDSIAIPQRG